MFLKTLAYAKINIGLEVLGKRADAYHEINTVFATVCIHDEIISEESTEIAVVCEPDLGIPMNENLVYKAAMALKTFYSIPAGAKISIKKNIITGSGLGGGSSDAAATLKLLCQLWEIPENESDLHTIATSLGMDIPFFLRNGFAIGRGRGELLEFFDFHLPYFIVIVTPGINISTKMAYQGLKIDSNRHRAGNLKQILLESRNNHHILKEQLRNDFEPYVFEKEPVIKQIKEALYECGAIFALMSGSGSAVYGFFLDSKDTITAKAKLSKFKTYTCTPVRNSFQ